MVFTVVFYKVISQHEAGLKAYMLRVR